MHEAVFYSGVEKLGVRYRTCVNLFAEALVVTADFFLRMLVFWNITGVRRSHGINAKGEEPVELGTK